MCTVRYRRCKHGAGFTLVEFVISIVLLAILATAGASLMSSMFGAYTESRDVVGGDGQARVAFERMTRELRDIRPLTCSVASQTCGCGGTCTGTCTGITLTPSTEVTFIGSDGN